MSVHREALLTPKTNDTERSTEYYRDMHMHAVELWIESCPCRDDDSKNNLALANQKYAEMKAELDESMLMDEEALASIDLRAETREIREAEGREIYMTLERMRELAYGSPIVPLKLENAFQSPIVPIIENGVPIIPPASVDRVKAMTKRERRLMFFPEYADGPSESESESEDDETLNLSTKKRRI